VSDQPATAERVQTNSAGYWQLLNGAIVDVTALADPDADPRLTRSNLAVHTVAVDLPRYIRRHIRDWYDRTGPATFTADPGIAHNVADDPRGVLTQEVLAMVGEVMESTDLEGGVREVPILAGAA